MKEQINKIKELSNNLSLLYVEDNVGLRENMKKLLSNIFDVVITGEDGLDGFNNFVTFRPKIVITDINMPHINGFKLIKKIHAVDPECKIIILSAYDEKEHLHTAINLGVFRYLRKPTKIPELVQAVYDAVVAINVDENRRLFFNQMNTIFNYQNNIVIMMHENEFTLCNQRFLEFFGVDNLEDFKEKYGDITNLLLEHKGFFYSTPSSNWYDVITKSSGVLFHTKIKNKAGEERHLILKSRDIPEKENYFVLSFDDITELNLMSIFDSTTAKKDSYLQEKRSILALMNVVKNNSSEVKIHNFYRGLSIVNTAVIVNITDDEVTIKTVLSQLKIIKMTKFMTISSEIFPKNIVCRAVTAIDLENQSVTLQEMSFIQQNLANRKFIRLEPDPKHSCTIFYKDIKFQGITSIIDISEVSIKIAIDALPVGMEIGSNLKISFTLPLRGRTISIITDADIYRIDENQRNYYLVTLFELNPKNKHDLQEYLVERQMELIREYKKIDLI